jgi:Jacalin-like lectin domain
MFKKVVMVFVFGLYSMIAIQAMEGGKGGGNFNMETIGQERVTKVFAQSGFLIDGIGMEFNNNRSEYAGGKGGDYSEMNLDPEEYIVAIQGVIGDQRGCNEVRGSRYINCLGIVTNYRTHWFGDSYLYTSGERGRSNFQILAGPNKEICGFYGKSGFVLDSIGVFRRNL